jgi:xanthine dehydrogenase accessory factor
VSDWLHTLRLVGERGLDAVLVTVASGMGSMPRETGAKMVLTVDAAHGTIGGGELEFQALEVARNMLRCAAGEGTDPGGRAAKRFPLGADLGQFCGGAANLVFERVRSEEAWVRELAAWRERGEACVIATPTSGEGRLLVRAGGTWGSLGAGALDAQAAGIAHGMLADGERVPRLVSLGDGVPTLFEPLLPADFNVVVFGAGHVGRALVRVLATLPCRVAWIDSRAGEFPREAPDNARVVRTDASLAEVASARAGSYFLVMTHSHALDFELVEAILKRGDFAYCGMIGSATKRKTFENGLAKRDVAAAARARLVCPIGIPTIKGKEPGAIAVAVAAQLLEHRQRSTSGVDGARTAIVDQPADR